YKNDLVPLTEVRTQIRRACTTLRDKKDFPRSLQLAHLYAKIARPGEAEDLRARAADDWATELSNARANDKAVEQYREAGKAYVALAGTTPTPADKARAYHRAAERYFRARDYAPALAVLEEYRKIETVPENLGESWLLTAQVYQALENRDSAA